MNHTLYAVVGKTEEGDPVSVPLVELVAPERPGDFTEVIHKNGDSHDLRTKNLLRATESQVVVWDRLSRIEDADRFDEVMTWAINNVAGDRDFLREMLDWFDPAPSA